MKEMFSSTSRGGSNHREYFFSFFEELVLYRSICNSDNHFYSSYHKLFKTELTARRCTESFFITICSNPALSR